jgi:hypothetical protein
MSSAPVKAQRCQSGTRSSHPRRILLPCIAVTLLLGLRLPSLATAQQLPNLVPQNITLNKSSVEAGSTLTINWTLANTGNGSSPSTVTGVRLNQSSSSGNTQPYTAFSNVAMPALNANSSTPQSTTITIPSGTAAGTYYIWIIADNVANSTLQQSNYADDYQRSAAFTVTTTVAPSPPTLNPATGVTATGATLSWSGVSGATDYRVQVSTSSSFSTSPDGWDCFNCIVGGNVVVSAPTISYTLAGLSADTTYYWRVWGRRSSGTQLFVNGHQLSAPQAQWVRFVAQTILPQLLGDLTGQTTVAARATWWALKEGVLSLDNPHVFCNCNVGPGQDQRCDLDPLTVCNPGHAWQVGLAAVRSRTSQNRTCSTLSKLSGQGGA